MQENVSLKEYTTMKTGGSARYFFCAKSIDEVREAAAFANERAVPLFVLGGGSNVIISDDGWNGVVLRMEIPGIAFEDVDADTVRVVAGAGVQWDALVRATVGKSLYGIENLSGIPGTVGAAPVQNIGAYGVEAGESIAWVEVFDMEKDENCRMGKDECLFGYRESFFKTPQGRKMIITRVAFDLKKNGALKTDYKDIGEYFSRTQKEATLSSLREAIIEIRASKLPDHGNMGTAGSFFKNPVISESEALQLKRSYPDVVVFPANNGLAKVSAAWLLDHIGQWRGVCRGDACVYERHALVLVNKGNATTGEILALADEMAQMVKTKTGIVLEREVQIVA